MKLLQRWSMIGGIVVCSALPVWSQSYEELIAKSYEYTDRNELPAAAEALKAAMRLEPGNQHNYLLLTNLGTLQRRQGLLSEAVVSYTAALSRQPGNPVILRNRAQLYTQMHETDKALADYETLLQATPTDEAVRYDRAMLLIGTGDLLAAENDLELILKQHPDSEQGRLGYAVLEKMRLNYDECERILNYLIDKNPSNLRLYEERAELYFLIKKNGRAMADLHRVFAATPEPSPELYVLRGRVKLAQYERESATADFAKAKALGYDAATIDALLVESLDTQKSKGSTAKNK